MTENKLTAELDLANEEIGRAQGRLENIQRLWMTNVVKPYRKAYGEGLGIYQGTLNAQIESDKQKIQTIVSLMALFGGSLLTAVAANGALANAIDDKVINVLAKRRMEQTFNAYANLRTGTMPAVIAGGLYGMGGTALSDGVKKQMESNKVFRPPFAPKKADEIESEMDGYLKKVFARSYSLLDAIKGSRAELKLEYVMPAPEQMERAKRKLELADKVMTGPLYNPPTREITTTHLARDIALGMFMRLVLSSDFKATLKWRAMPHSKYGGEMVEVRTPIAASPLDANYPKGNSKYRVGVQDLGSKIESKVNELYKSFTNSSQQFFETGAFDFLYNNNSLEVVRKAAVTLDKLSGRRVPLKGG